VPTAKHPRREFGARPGNADDRACALTDRYLLADDRRIAAEPPLPEAVAEDDREWSTAPILSPLERAAKQQR
jgi:hypothetical protein